MILAQAHLLTGSWVCLCPRLVAAILSVARKQYSLLKAANLLTPDMVSEFEELERLVHQGAGVSLEQATSPNRPSEVGGATPAQETQQGCDGEGSALGTVGAVPSPLSRGALEEPVGVGAAPSRGHRAER